MLLTVCFIPHEVPTNISQDVISWTWNQSCTDSVRNASNSSLEILENGMYYIYIYVARKEDFSTDYYFTVVLFDDSRKRLGLLKGPNVTRAFVSMGRPYFLGKGKTLHIEINGGLANIDKKETYWGLFKI